MRQRFLAVSVLAIVVLLVADTAVSQVRWTVGGRLGMSLYTVSSRSFTYSGFFFQPVETTVSSTSAGLQIGPMGEVLFARQFAIGTGFNINTQGGTPIEWQSYFKTFFPISGSKIKPYADAGFSLFFITGGPYFCVFGGGGALFPIAPNLYIPADLQLGPVFLTGTTGFYLAVTSGIRYEIPS
jgi:hypothetical protein